MTNDEEDFDFDNAVANHIRSIHGDGMLTGYYIVAEFIDADGDECWFTKSPERQTLNKTLGLMAFADADLKYQTQLYLAKLMEGED
jgi:hypothetical protein